MPVAAARRTLAFLAMAAIALAMAAGCGGAPRPQAGTGLQRTHLVVSGSDPNSRP
jgi:hypothetical protein